MQNNSVRLFYGSLPSQPEPFDIFQRLSGGFRHQLPYDQHIGYAHECKQEECACRCGILQHPRGKLSDQIGSHP